MGERRIRGVGENCEGSISANPLIILVSVSGNLYDQISTHRVAIYPI